MRNTGPIAVRKLHPLFGAEVSGIDITRPAAVWCDVVWCGEERREDMYKC